MSTDIQHKKPANQHLSDRFEAIKEADQISSAGDLEKLRGEARALFGEVTETIYPSDESGQALLYSIWEWLRETKEY